MKKFKIVSNKAKCRACGTIVESTSRHHLELCPCGKIFVDGGKDYLRRGGELSCIEELSECEPVENPQKENKQP